MRIERLRIDGFGRFADRSFGPLEGPVTVFYGPNEAGKSTLLAFLRTMLFGFPDRKRDEHYPAPGSNVHGGRLWLRDDTGLGFEVSRSESKRGLAMSVTTTDGRTSNDGSLLRAALGHASKETFESVFAFSLAELQQLSTLSKGDAAARIYSAGMGAAKLPEVQREIEKRREGLFKPRGSNQVVAETLGRLEHIEKQLREASGNADRYASLIKRQSEITQEIQGISSRNNVLTREHKRAQSLRRAWDDWLELTTAREALDRIPAIDGFPMDGRAQLDRLVTRHEGAVEAHREAQHQLEAILATTVPDGALAILEHEDAIDSLQQDRGAFSASVSDAPKRQAELQAARESFDAALREIGQTWDATRVEQFDASVEVRAEVDRWRQELDRHESNRRAATDRAERAQEAHKQAQDRLGTFREELEALPVPAYSDDELDARRSLIVRAKTALGVSRQAEAEVESYRREAAARRQVQQAVAVSNPFYPFAGALSIIAVVAFASGMMLGGGALPLGAVAGIALLLIASAGVYVFRPRSTFQTGPSDGLLQSTERRFADAQEVLRKAAEGLGITTVDEESLDRLEIALHRAEDGTRAYGSKLEGVRTATEEVRRLAVAVADTAEQVTRAAVAQGSVAAEWASWISERGLPSGLAPQSMDALFARIEGARAELRSERTARHRLEAIERDIERYGERVLAVANLTGLRPTPNSNESAMRAADSLIASLKQARDARARQDANEQEAERRSAAVTKAAEDAGRIEDSLSDLLKSGGVTTTDEFRRRCDDQAERGALLRKARDAETRLRRIVDQDSGGGGADALFRSTDAIALEARVEELDGEMLELASQREDLAREAGEIAGDLRRITGDEQTSVLRAEREVLREKLAAAAREWATLTVAQSMLRDALDRYQRERQPGVIKSAGAMFSMITEGRYSNLMSPIGDDKNRELTVRDRDGTTKAIEQLSRGTQEALYLALRFGLVRQFGEQACSLPVIVDEVLVNLDPLRQERTAQQFAELAKTNQILVFTCHPSIVDLFCRTEPNSQVIEIEA